MHPHVRRGTAANPRRGKRQGEPAAHDLAAAPAQSLTKPPLPQVRQGNPASSLDDLVGTGEEGGGYPEANALRGAQVDHELETRRLGDWQIAGFGAFQDTGRVNA